MSAWAQRRQPKIEVKSVRFPPQSGMAESSQLLSFSSGCFTELLGVFVKMLRWISSILGMVMASTAIGVSPPTPKIEQAVIVHFSYGSKDLTRLFALEEKLEAAISKADVGEYDGNEAATDGSDGYLYMYGPNADRLFEVIKPILQSTPFMSGATVKKRYGPAEVGVKESVVVITP